MTWGSELCPTGGRDNILRFEKSVDAVGDDAVPVDDPGGTAPIKADGVGDAHVQIPYLDGRGDDVQIQVRVNEGIGDIQDLVAEEGACRVARKESRSSRGPASQLPLILRNKGLD